MILSQLGILIAGAGFVPIDPHLPLSRIAFILKDSGPQKTQTYMRVHMRAHAHSLTNTLTWASIHARIYTQAHANKTIRKSSRAHTRNQGTHLTTPALTSLTLKAVAQVHLW